MLHFLKSSKSKGAFQNVWLHIFLALLLYALGFGAIRFGLVFVGIFGMVFPLLILGYALYERPSLAIPILFVTAYFNMGIARYVPIQMGLFIDGLLGFFWIVLIFKGGSGDVQWKRANQLITWVALLWFGYLTFELLNPVAPSRTSWIYSARGMGEYFVLVAIVTLLTFYKYQDWSRLLTIWGVLTLLALIRAMIQKYVGFDSYELQWLKDGGAITHIISSGTRYFSFFTDAGQFGATMGHSGIVFLIMSFREKSLVRKTFFIIVSLAGFWAMLMSGTRGAFAVPAVGILVYIVLCRDIRYFVAATLLAVFVFVFFNYTYIGQGVYEIRRMRSVFSYTQDDSYNVRVENQKKFSAYLAGKPFGAGLGTSSANGQRFYPNSYLASIATDSWYVIVWVETGIIGISFYLGMMVLLILYGSYISLFKIKNDKVNHLLRALLAGAAGVLVASYSNSVIGQFPSSIIYAMSLAFPFLAMEMDRDESGQNLLTP